MPRPGLPRRKVRRRRRDAALRHLETVKMRLGARTSTSAPRGGAVADLEARAPGPRFQGGSRPWPIPQPGGNFTV